MTTAFPAPPQLAPPPPGPPRPLPERWRAVALLTPWRSAQLVVAEVVCDSTLDAMRVRLHGLEQGRAELLFTDGAGYVVHRRAEGTSLEGPVAVPVMVPGPDWLADHVVCQGVGDVLGIPCTWWTGSTTCRNSYQNQKTPPSTVANTFNLRADTGAPLRFVFVNPDNDYRLPVLGAYAIVHLPEFAALDHTDLQDLLDLVPKAMPPAPGLGLATADDFDRLLAASDIDPADPTDGVATLLPGIGPPGDHGRLPSWPERMFLTSFSTPTAGPAPLPTQVFYDWPRRRMLTRLWTPDGGYEDAVLDSSSTHVVARHPDGSHTCVSVLPVGLVKPHWAGDDRGACRAVIKDHPVLSPGRTTYVCVLPSRPGQVFWTWYTGDDEPVMFIEVPQACDVMLLLTDYADYDPAPGPFDDALFDVPADCRTGA